MNQPRNTTKTVKQPRNTTKTVNQPKNTTRHYLHYFTLQQGER